MENHLACEVMRLPQVQIFDRVDVLCGVARGRVITSGTVEKRQSNMIGRPPRYFRWKTRAISVDSQINPIWNADGAGDA
jgi:hypothetical protein